MLYGPGSVSYTHLLLVLTAKTLLRFLPPLTITYEELDKGLAILAEVLKNL